GPFRFALCLLAWLRRLADRKRVRDESREVLLKMKDFPKFSPKHLASPEPYAAKRHGPDVSETPCL
ncbi:MAG TPA: hypothetical protein PKZ01_12110, partial [Candidatus Hydrogenedentes bacterium]|nr:hypothetical protein [Candidatus Hydrogenedentota bacterium]